MESDFSAWPGSFLGIPTGLLWALTVTIDSLTYLALKAPITTAADDTFCDLFPNF